MKRLLLGLALSSVVVGSAAAQNTPAKNKKPQKVKVLDMGKGEDVNGDTVTKPFASVSVIDYGTSSSLIRIRREFVDLILKSAEQI